MTIRIATPADLDAIVGCADQAFETTLQLSDGDGDSLNEDLLQQIHQGQIHVISSDCNSAIVGYISLLPVSDHLFVDSIAVLPEQQGDGLGTQMLVFAEQEAVRLGLPSVKLFTKLNEGESLGFYRYCGFTETGRCDNDGFPRIFYSKVVTHNTAAVSASRFN